MKHCRDPAKWQTMSCLRRRAVRKAKKCKGSGLQDREFFAAIREGREPNASIAQVLHQLEQQLANHPYSPRQWPPPARVAAFFAPRMHPNLVIHHQPH